METKRILITPKLAAEYLSKMDINRPLSIKTVLYYSDEMSRGQWCEDTHQGIAFDSNDSLVDGQHRLKAIIHSQKSIYMTVTYGVSLGAFRTMDSGMNRRIGHIMAIDGIKNYNSHAAGISSYIAYTKSKRNENGKNRRLESKITSIDAIEFYNTNSDLCIEALSNSSKWYGKRRYVTTTYLYMFFLILVHRNNKPVEQVISFFDQVFDIENTKSDICELLKNRLYQNQLSKAKLPVSFLIPITIKAWNAFYTGKHLKVLKYQEDEPFPEIL